MQPWQRTFWIVFVANLVTAVGMMSFLPFFPSYLEELGLRDPQEIAVWTGLVFGAAPLSAALMGPLWGSIGDRFGRKAMVLRALLAITFFVGSMAFVRTPWQLLVLRVAQGVFSGFVPPSITLVSVAAPREVQGRIAGSMQASLAGGSIVGPLVGAFVQNGFGIRSVFLFVGGASGLAALLVGFCAAEDPSLRLTLERFSPTSVLTGAARDFARILSDGGIRAAVLLLFVVQFGLGATNPLLELYVRELGPAGDAGQLTAWLFTALALSMLVSTPIWGRLSDRFGHERMLWTAAVGSGVALLLQGILARYGWLLAMRVLLGLFATGASAAAFGVAATRTATANRGSALGAVFSARALAVSVGAITGGWLAARTGVRELFLLAGATILVAASIGRVLRERRGAPRDAGAPSPSKCGAPADERGP